MEWARQTRLLLSPPEILLPNGEIDQDFFRPHEVINSQAAWGYCGDRSVAMTVSHAYVVVALGSYTVLRGEDDSAQ